GAFIKNILENKNSQIIVDAIVGICNKSDIDVIAEFVSSEKIYEYIKSLGIEYAQGYYISPPVEHISDVL
ncbi:MAG: EAL domain-containing protein, partial [Epsilonproteobacteria bacterium]|nr:EAL domain-containing protein [Campylobacterota bacterium]